MIKTISILFFIIIHISVIAGITPTSCNCCATDYKQFDFWIGDWDVFNTKGVKVGENNIVSLQDSCILQENWKSGNQTGTSYNFYNNTDSSWNQIYVDNGGNVLELKGNLKNGKMVLESKKLKSTKGDFNYFNRITWTKDSLGNVSQIWNIVDDKEKILQVAFDGIYKRKVYESKPDSMKKVTGIGGIFFKCKDPEKLKTWYNKHLGLATDQYGTNFEWRQADDNTKKGFTQWSPFNQNTKYFEPSAQDFMINYRVDNLEALVEVLRKEGVTIVDEMEVYEYGKFIHILDGEGNKVELWEPIDIVYDQFEGGRTK